VVDVTAEKKSQETLFENELRLRLAVEAAQLGTFDWDIITSALQYSEKFAGIPGRKEFNS
jgi:PAS domain-containing protein